MQKKKDTQLQKRITALVMSGVLLATSVPLMTRPMAAEPSPTDGHWSPEPYFSDAAKDEGAAAWFQNDGSIAVKFPAAIGGETSFREQEKKKNIEGYMFEIFALGKKNPDLTGAPEALPETPIYSTMVAAADVIKTMDGKSFMLTKLFQPGEIQMNGQPVTRDTDVRLDIRITAVDDGKWFSEPIDTIVTDVPVFEYDEQKYELIDERNEYAMRQITMFENGWADKSKRGLLNDFPNEDDRGIEFSNLDPNPETSVSKIVPEVGAPYGIDAGENKVGRPSNAIGFRIKNLIGATGSKNFYFDSALSREAYDFTNTDEIWFWFDCSEVHLKDVSFRLRYNEKLMRAWKDANVNPAPEGYGNDNMSRVPYSTKGFSVNKTQAEIDAAKPILMQSADGGWKQVKLSANGTVDLDHFKGYVRVPLELFCAEEDVTVNMHANVVKNAYYNNPFIQGKENFVTLTKAGTPITEGYLTQLVETWKGWSTTYTDKGFAPAVMVRDAGTESGRRIFWDGTAFVDKGGEFTDAAGNKKTGAFKAIEDIYSAGFEIGSYTEESVKKEFFYDNVMAYKKPIIDEHGVAHPNPFPDDQLNGGSNSIGKPVNNFYNQKLDRANIILNAIDNLILAPAWTNYKEVEYISDMIKGFSLSFGEKPGNPKNIFADTDENATNGMTAMAIELDRLDTWKKYRTARALCLEYGTIQEVNGELQIPANADMTDLVPGMIEILENLPPRDWMVNPDAKQKAEIIKLYQAYVTLNRTQLEALGTEEIKACFDYFAILGKSLGASQNDFVVGQHLAEKPFLPFCDFEQCSIGMNQIVPRVEDDHHSYYGAETDCRHTKGVNTMAGPVGNIHAKGEYLPQNAIPNSTSIHATTAVMRPDGFMGSKAPRIYIHSNSNAVNTLTVSRDGKDNADLNALKRSGGCGANGYQLGKLAKGYSGNESDEATEPPLSLIFYVDFTELDKEFNMAVNIFSTNNDGTIVKLRPNLSLFGTDSNRKFFLLDPETGNWELTHCAATQYHFNSESNANDKLDLNGYKGYVRIPLYHIKGGALDDTKLDETAEWLNNIFAIQIGVGGAGMQGKSYVIDNIGFTYSENYYNPNGQQKPKDKTYEEIYNAKANPALEFEYAVDELDAFRKDQTTEVENVKNAIKLYDGLTDHQRTLPSVKNAVIALQRAAKWANLEWNGQPNSLPVIIPGESVRPNAVDPFADPTITADVLESEKMTYKRESLTLKSFKAYVEDANLFPTEAKKADLSVKTGNNVRFPGFNTKQNDPLAVGEVNYAGLGFKDKDQVDRILLLFEYGFSRLSWADQMKFQKAPALDNLSREADIWNKTDEEINALPDSPQFIEAWNVYKAAVRCRELEKTRTAVEEICQGNKNAVPPVPEEQKHEGIFSMYKSYGYKPEDAGPNESEKIQDFTEIARRGEIENLYNKVYVAQPYYAKVAAQSGAVVPILNNFASSVNLFLLNSKEYQFGAQAPTAAGLLQLQQKYTELNTELNKVIAKDQLIQSSMNPRGLWENILYAIDDYTNLLNNFKRTGELYTPIEHIRRKFPIVKTTTAPETDTTRPAGTDLFMTEKNNYTDKTVANSFQVTYAVDLSQLDGVNQNWLTFKPTAGVMKVAANMEGGVPYELTLQINKVKRDAQGAVLSTEPVKDAVTALTAKQIQAAVAGAPIGLCQIEPNLYGKDADGNSYSLEVQILSKMNAADIPVNAFYGEDTFTLEVKTKNGADFVPFVNAKNQNYASSITPKTYTVAYGKGDTYSVSFPAETQVNWGTTAPVDVSYQVTSQMADTASLKVTVEDAKAAASATPYQFLLNGTDTKQFLAYTPAGFTTPTEFKGVLNNVKPQTACTLTIPTEEWKKSIGDYQTTLTYTVEYKNDSTPAPEPTPGV